MAGVGSKFKNKLFFVSVREEVQEENFCHKDVVKVIPVMK